MRPPSSFLSQEEIVQVGFKSIGSNPKVSRHANFYNPSKISLGNNVRIDDFAILSAGEEGIDIGSNVHIAAFCFVSGIKKIVFEDFCGLSSRVSVYSSSDDYVRASLTNSTIPDQYKNIVSKEIIFRRHTIIGCGSVIIPGAAFGEGTAVGALSLVMKPLDAWTVYLGVPVKEIRKRKKNEDLEKKFLEQAGK